MKEMGVPGRPVRIGIVGLGGRGQGQLSTLLGMEDVVVVDTADVLLVTSKAHAQDVKKLVERMKVSGGGHLL